MIPVHHQQQHHLPYRQQQQQRMYFDHNQVPASWLNQSWSGVVQGQPMSFYQPPPFYYPCDMNIPYVDPSSAVPKNHVRFADQAPTPHRGILKHGGQRSKTSRPRQLRDFMPEKWRNNRTYSNNNKFNSKDRRQPNQLPDQKRNSKTPEKAHNDTIRRRERRQRSRRALLEKDNESNLFNDNRFMLLSATDDNTEEDTDIDNSVVEIVDNDNKKKQTMNKNKMKKGNKQKNRKDTRTTDPDDAGEDIRDNNKQETTRGNHQRRTLASNNSDTEDDNLSSNGNENHKVSNKDKRKTKSYLQNYKIHAYITNRINNDIALKFDLGNVLSEIDAYASNTIEAYDKWTRNNYEAQVWKRLYNIGKDENHWAKEIVLITRTREAEPNLAFCENKIAQFTH